MSEKNIESLLLGNRSSHVIDRIPDLSVGNGMICGGQSLGSCSIEHNLSIVVTEVEVAFAIRIEPLVQ